MISPTARARQSLSMQTRLTVTLYNVLVEEFEGRRVVHMVIRAIEVFFLVITSQHSPLAYCSILQL